LGGSVFHLPPTRLVGILVDGFCTELLLLQDDDEVVARKAGPRHVLAAFALIQGDVHRHRFCVDGTIERQLRWRRRQAERE